MTDDDQSKRLILDSIEPVEVVQDDYSNELGSLRTQLSGIKQLCAMVKNRELAFERAAGGKFKFVQYGATSAAEREFLDMVACCFHWFGVSVWNYARLVGFIRGLSRGDFMRADLKDRTKFKLVKDSVEGYVSSVPELECVKVWRNKVFAHFAITDPFKDDNIATLDMSVIFPVSFEGRYVVGGMTMTRKDSTGTHVSGLPRWSLTEVFESLVPRYWPGLTFRLEDPSQVTEATVAGTPSANGR